MVFLKAACVGHCYFYFFINDISKVLNNCKVSLYYADDTVLYLSGKTLDEVMASIQEDLLLSNRWCNKNRSTINCKKTKYCIYGIKSIVNQNNSQDMIISLSNTVLEKVNSVGYLLHLR